MGQIACTIRHDIVMVNHPFFLSFFFFFWGGGGVGGEESLEKTI